MGNLRFWRRFKIFPGVYINISKSGLSISFGSRGYTLTFGKRGIRSTTGIPGSGLFYTHHTNKDKVKDALTKK